MTALMLAASAGSTEMVKMLLQAGADPELQEEVRIQGEDGEGPMGALAHPRQRFFSLFRTALTSLP